MMKARQIKNLWFALAAFLLATAPAFGEIIKNGSLRASSDGSNVTLQWISEDETGVTRFEIERRTGTDGSFTLIGSIDSKGASLYEFVDYSAFRKAVILYQYRLKIVFSNGTTPTYTAPMTVSHTVSGVRRTWGSIKSMFR